ncbi:hypothetical protein Chor_004566 [Crotalus horridus]
MERQPRTETSLLLSGCHLDEMLFIKSEEVPSLFGGQIGCPVPHVVLDRRLIPNDNEKVHAATEFHDVGIQPSPAPTPVNHHLSDHSSCKSCPSYRNKWKDYWYMGSKCNYLWSTLDLILMITVPAVTLSVVVFTLMQWIGYCKSPSKKSRSQVQQPRISIPVIPPRPQPQRQPDAQPRQMLAFPRPLIQDQQEIPFPERLSYSPQRPLPTVPSTQAGRGNPWMNEIPSADYDQQNPFEALPMRQLLKPKASTLPLPDYGENSSQPMNDLITNMPSRFVRPQYTYN